MLWKGRMTRDMSLVEYEYKDGDAASVTNHCKNLACDFISITAVFTTAVTHHNPCRVHLSPGPRPGLKL